MAEDIQVILLGLVVWKEISWQVSIKLQHGHLYEPLTSLLVRMISATILVVILQDAGRK